MELLIVIKDKPVTSRRQAAELVGRRGDVITVQPDGFPWSKAEMENPDWVVVRADLLPSEVQALLSPETNEGRYKPFCHTRQNKLDLSKLPVRTSNEIQRVEKMDLHVNLVNKGVACAER